MTSAADGQAARSARTDRVLRTTIALLVCAVLGAALLLGYTVWEGRKREMSSTPAQRALQTLADFVQKNPNSAAAHVRYAEALAAAGLDEESNAQLLKAVDLDKTHTGAWLDLGILALRNHRSDAAEKYFTKVVALTEGSEYESINQRREEALYYLGEINVDRQDYTEATAFLKEALRIRKDSSTSYYMLAQALHGLEKDDAALEQLDACLSFDPNYAEAHYLYGMILLDRKDDVNAAVHLVRATELAPQADAPKEALATLGTAEDAMKAAEKQAAAGRYGDAIESALLARALEPKNVDAAVLHANILLNRGDRRSAAAVLAEAVKLDPKDPGVVKLATLLHSK